MKVSWRNVGEEHGTLDHHQTFGMGEKRDNMGPRDFMVYLINKSSAIEVALNGKIIWDGTDYSKADDIVIRAMIGEPREASILISIDYNTQDDWIDNECRACSGVCLALTYNVPL